MNTTVTQRHPALQPSKIGRFELTNRLVVAPMSRVSAAADGTPTDEMTDYYAQFASGGFGLVITEGSVRVLRQQGDGERLITTYGAGDHIGELAVLREAPRSATVVAQDPGIRSLVIGGDGLAAILRERPEAAMATLATIAERISRQ